MRKSNTISLHLSALLVLHACSAVAAPNLLVTRPGTRSTEWLPRDNQTVYRLEMGKIRRLELNTSGVTDRPVYITVSPCSLVHWAVYHGRNDGHLSIVKEYIGTEASVYSTIVTENDRYVLQLSAPRGGAAAISVRGEKPKPSRLRLRVRSRRRLSAVWDPSPIDPHATSYCVVASHRKNYTSLCAAQFDIKTSKTNENTNSSERRNQYNAYRVRKAERKYGSGEKNGFSVENDTSSMEMDNIIDTDDSLGIYDGSFKSVFRRKKFSRSTKVSEQDPVIACIGDRTRHFIDNLDPSRTYFVSVFGVAQDRRAGTLLASSSIVPRTSVAKKLKENVPFKAELRGRMVFYYKTTISTGEGLRLAVSTCGGAVDVDVSVRGKRLYILRNIELHENIFVPAPVFTQGLSDESSVQIDSSSSEEARVRYVVKIAPSQREREYGVKVELTASSTKSGVGTVHLSDASVKELRPRRTCRSVDIAFLPATVNATDVIRYCTSARESLDNSNTCSDDSRTVNQACVSPTQTHAKVIVQRISNLEPGHRYEVKVVASTTHGFKPYRALLVETSTVCKDIL